LHAIIPASNVVIVRIISFAQTVMPIRIGL